MTAEITGIVVRDLHPISSSGSIIRRFFSLATPLRIGEYSIAVEATGFKTQTRKNIVLQVQDRLRIDFDLQVGDIKDQVIVEDVRRRQGPRGPRGRGRGRPRDCRKRAKR
jgi:hypothetical protein